MTDIMTKFRRESGISTTTITEDEVREELYIDCLARFNQIMATAFEIDDYDTTGNDEVDLALCYLLISHAFKSEYMRRLVADTDAWVRYEQMAFGIMMEIDSTKIGQRPVSAGGGLGLIGQYYIRGSTSSPANMVRFDAETY